MFLGSYDATDLGKIGFGLKSFYFVRIVAHRIFQIPKISVLAILKEIDDKIICILIFDSIQKPETDIFTPSRQN